MKSHHNLLIWGQEAIIYPELEVLQSFSGCYDEARWHRDIAKEEAVCSELIVVMQRTIVILFIPISNCWNIKM